MQHTRWFAGALGIAVLFAQNGALADEELEYEHEAGELEMEVEVEPQSPYGRYVFLEALGGYGLQIGNIEYFPAGTPGDYQYPLVHGWNVGGTAGVMLGDQVALVASYEYTNADTIEGGITGVLDRVQGFIDYHTVAAGLRLYVPVGFGRFRAELEAGVMLPFETVLEFDYGPALTQLPTPITGSGRHIQQFSVGVGGQAALGYDFPLIGGLYMAIQLRLKLYQSENSGEAERFENFVTDFEATPPTATTATIVHGDGAARPDVRSVQEGTLQLGLGYGF